MSGDTLAPGAVARMDAALPYVRSWLAYRVWKAGIPGAQFAVRYDGRLALSGAVGVADLASGEPLTPGHLIRFASHSKMFTATAVLQLVEQGLMTLDGPVSTYIPEFSMHPVGERRLRELLDHTAGVIRDGEDGDFWQRHRPFPHDEEIIDMAAGASIKSAAGERFGYSNLGFAIVGLAVARASGRSWHEYVRTDIIERLNLDDTFTDLPAHRAADLARGYSGTHTSPERREIPPLVLQSLAPAGGVTSTARDMSAFLDALRVGDDRLLSEHSVRTMQRVSSADPSVRKAGGGYGLGIIIEEVHGRALVGHSGGFTGAISWSMRDPASGIAVSVATTSTDGAADEIGAGIFALLLTAAADSGRAPLGDTTRFEGRFANIWRVADVVRLGERLVVLNPELADPLASVEELAVVNDDTLVVTAGNGYGSVGELVRYSFDDHGGVRDVRLGYGLTSWPFNIAEDRFVDPWTRFARDPLTP